MAMIIMTLIKIVMCSNALTSCRGDHPDPHVPDAVHVRAAERAHGGDRAVPAPCGSHRIADLLSGVNAEEMKASSGGKTAHYPKLVSVVQRKLRESSTQRATQALA